MSTTYDELTPEDIAILDFENAWWKHAGAKDTAIRDRFELTPTAYYQRLNQLIDRTSALIYAPMLVKRLRRLRDARRAERSSRRLSS